MRSAVLTVQRCKEGCSLHQCHADPAFVTLVRSSNRADPVDAGSLGSKSLDWSGCSKTRQTVRRHT